jgi:hypothetical protein
MKYRLVLQFPASSIRDYDDMVALEIDIIGVLGDVGEVDGHDAGSGEMNIFVDTNDPSSAFERIMTLARAIAFSPELKVAYREKGTTRFTALKPFGLADFRVK